MPGNFVACLAGRDKGVGSAGVSDPTGRDYVYRIDAGALQNGIDGGWTYADLIKYIADNASVSNLPRAYGGN